MTEVTQDKTFELKAVVQAKMANMLLYQPLGDGSEKFIYITHQIKRNYKTGTENVTNTVQKMLKSHISPKTTKWSYQESWAKTLLALLTTITNLQNKKTPSTLLVTG